MPTQICILYCPLEITICKHLMHFREEMQMSLYIADLHYLCWRQLMTIILYYTAKTCF
jgi:hypothetical protein